MVNFQEVNVSVVGFLLVYFVTKKSISSVPQKSLQICSTLQAEIEELRDDKATRVTQKELQEMFNELLLGYDNPATFQQEQEVLFSEFIDSQETKYV